MRPFPASSPRVRPEGSHATVACILAKGRAQMCRGHGLRTAGCGDPLTEPPEGIRVMTDTHTSLVARLRSIVGPEHVLTDADQRASYELDWTGVWHGTALAVVRPLRDGEVTEVVRACLDARVPVVPQGGRTGLVGGGVPADGGVVLTTERMRTLLPVEADGTVVVGAGATLSEVQRHATAAGWQLGVDIAARAQATIGGMVATDAGGIAVVGHGSMRDHVTGLVVVLPDGNVATPRQHGTPPADRDERALHAAMIGSEGTLGVITTVQLQLDPPATVGVTALVRVRDLAEVAGAVNAIIAAADRAKLRLLACELMTAHGMTLVAQTLGVASPATDGFEAALLLDLAAPATEDAVAAVCGPLDDDPIVALSAPGRRRVWEIRERHTEALAMAGPPVKLDVAVPVTRLGDALAGLPDVVREVAPGATVVCFGHAAEGRLHVNVLGASGAKEPVAAAVYELVASLAGSVVSEHGTGRAKLAYLHLTADRGMLTEARAIKNALDPQGLMNPGVRLPPATPPGS
ncbi:MAG: FAD/FMN-containing dehydrogenase [Myxococcota bacterium]|jgi:FAD/FMN-containing dehydrogenase